MQLARMQFPNLPDRMKCVNPLKVKVNSFCRETLTPHTKDIRSGDARTLYASGWQFVAKRRGSCSVQEFGLACGNQCEGVKKQEIK